MKAFLSSVILSFGGIVICLALLVFTISCGRISGASKEPSKALFSVFVANPGTTGSIAPNVTRRPDGEVTLSWLEPVKGGMALRFATRGEHDWSAAGTVVTRNDFPKYAEAPPWVMLLPDGGLVAVWAEEIPSQGKWPGNYLYFAVSRDQGKTWSKPLVIHADRSNSEHSFASLAVVDGSHANIVWLDARDYAAKHQYRLMSAVLSSEGKVSGEETLDDDVCTCCPTALARTSGGLIAAYRDHTSDNIRDIYWLRKESGHWQASHAVHNNGWRINACPVNGPAVASQGDRIAMAWYSGANEKGTVQVAFSEGRQATFQNPITIDSQQPNERPVGRPTLTFLSSGDLLIAWLRRQNDQTELVTALVPSGGEDIHPIVIAKGTTQGLGYPRMQSLGSGVLLSWGGAGDIKQINTALVTAR